jgi:Domain of unknown function (DUF4116)
MSDLRARLNKIIDLHGKALAEAVGQREPSDFDDLKSSRVGTKCATSPEACLSAKDLILHFAENDPTDGKSRTQWLVKTYIQDEQFKLEDLGRAHAALSAFERFKRKLPVEKRELSRFKSLQGLEELVDPFVKAEERARLTRDLSTATGRELRRLEEWKARDESVVIQEGDGLPTIAVPMTEFASKWWGRGTRWCTAAENNNVFARYHKDAPLVIMVCSDGAKFQMHVGKDIFQFMDNTDKDVSEKTIGKRWDEFKSLMYWAVQQNGDVLLSIPEKMHSLELYYLAIRQNGENLRHIPEEERTLELCRLAVEQNGKALRDVPRGHKTSELCRLAMEQNGRAIHYVPEREMTTELCRIAVEQNGEALRLVFDKYITPELLRLAVQRSGWALEHVPEKDKTPELCRLAVEQNGRALYFVPEKLKKSELCHIAVKQNGMALQFVPENKRTSKLCRLAIEQNGLAFEHVPTNLRKYDLCCLAVQQDGLVLKDIPDVLQTPELYRLALQQNGMALRYILPDQQTWELCCLAVEQNGEALQWVPEEYETHELLARVSPVQPPWNIDILQGLSKQFQLSNNSITPGRPGIV